MNQLLRTTFILLSATLLLALGGCAASRMIDSDVQSFTAAVPAVRPALYRFERLPSQADTPTQNGIEALAAQALAKVGVPHWLDLWGSDVSHEWVWWRRQIRFHLGVAMSTLERQRLAA